MKGPSAPHLTIVVMRKVRVAVGIATMLVLSPTVRTTAECVTVVVPGAKPLAVRRLMAQYDLVFRGKVIRTEKYGDTVFEVDRTR